MLIYLSNEIESVKFANIIAKFISWPLVITLNGEIGAGKTTLVRALLRALGITRAIKSPTFSLLESYDICGLQFRSTKLGSVDNSSSDALRPAACPLDPEILLNAQTSCKDIARTGSSGQAAGLTDLNCQQTLETNTDLKFHHFDLYRIDDESELEYIGFRDYFSKNDLCCIEWPEKAGRYLKDVDLIINLLIEGSGRKLQINGITPLGQQLLEKLRTLYEQYN
jgi:tRNA A37 threonylcarbamoyladenosine biosynthesis protein TsaE